MWLITVTLYGVIGHISNLSKFSLYTGYTIINGGVKGLTTVRPTSVMTAKAVNTGFSQMIASTSTNVDKPASSALHELMFKLISNTERLLPPLPPPPPPPILRLLLLVSAFVLQAYSSWLTPGSARSSTGPQKKNPWGRQLVQEFVTGCDVTNQQCQTTAEIWHRKWV